MRRIIFVDSPQKPWTLEDSIKPSFLLILITHQTFFQSGSESQRSAEATRSSDANRVCWEGHKRSGLLISPHFTASTVFTSKQDSRLVAELWKSVFRHTAKTITVKRVFTWISNRAWTWTVFKRPLNTFLKHHYGKEMRIILNQIIKIHIFLLHLFLETLTLKCV